MEKEESLAIAWAGCDALSARLVQYLEASEKEFAGLIQALDACWNMAESIQKAGSRLEDHAEAAQAGRNVLRESMLEGCGIFKAFMVQTEDAGRQLASAAQEANELLGMANQLQALLFPLQHIAFHFRIEASRLSAQDSASVLTDYEDMRTALAYLKQASDSQERTLTTILAQLLAASGSVTRASGLYATQAAESEERVERNIAMLLEVPREMLRVQNKTSALGTVLSKGLSGAVQEIQGHDAISQRLRNILDALARLRDGQEEEPEHVLMLQRQQSKSLLDHIVGAGTRIKHELNSAIGCVQSIAGDDQASASGDDDVARFEKATDYIVSLNAELDALLEEGAKIGHVVAAALHPVRELLIANRDELENLARTMRSMKLLALNVLISAGRMPSSKALGALGSATSGASASVLALERELTGRFARLGEALQSQAAAMTGGVQTVESYRAGLINYRPDEDFRNSRRAQRAQVTQLGQEARQLQKTAESLVQSLKFVDEGTALLGDLEETIDLLLALHPKSGKPFALRADAAGYTMSAQHEAHALVGGGKKPLRERLTVPPAGQDYGDNVELF
jgi:hypothetical protein